jgi:hypothetical protein
MSDEQDGAEALDEDVILGDDELYGAADADDVEFPTDRPSGVQFADADVTDESLADREKQMEPEPELDLGDEEQLADSEPEGPP